MTLWRPSPSPSPSPQVPVTSMLSLGIGVAGFCIIRKNMLVLTTNLEHCNVDFEKFEVTMDSFGIYLFVVNASVVISQGLLTGWTREALCKSLSTGTFETKGKGTVAYSHYQRRFITQFGVFFLKLLIGVSTELN